jgi:hypothetical protein
MDRETRGEIKRMCDIILGNESFNKELDSLALSIGHYPDILNLDGVPNTSDNNDVKTCRNCEHLFWCVEEGYQDTENPNCSRWKRHDFS